MPGTTINRLCASGLDAVGYAARAIKAGEIDLAIAGGVESMSRAPLVMAKAETAFQRSAEIHDTTIGWRFINPLMKAQYGVDSMPETGENVAEEFQVSRADQDAFALRSQQRAAARRSRRRLRRAGRRGRGSGPQGPDHRLPTTSIRAPTRRIEALAKLKPIVRDRRHGDRRQRLRRQRRRRRADRRLGRGGRSATA